MVYYEKQGPRYHPAGAVKEPEIQTANPEARSSTIIHAVSTLQNGVSMHILCAFSGH